MVTFVAEGRVGACGLAVGWNDMRVGLQFWRVVLGNVRVGFKACGMFRIFRFRV